MSTIGSNLNATTGSFLGGSMGAPDQFGSQPVQQAPYQVPPGLPGQGGEPPMKPPTGPFPVPVPGTWPPNPPFPPSTGGPDWPGEPTGPDTMPPIPPSLPGGEGPGMPDGPGVPPTKPPTGPGQEPPTTEPPGKGDGDGDGSILPWLLGAGALIGVGALGVAALHSGSRNIRGLHALDAAFSRGTIHQGGLQAIHDAGVGANVASVGLKEHLMVGLPVVNRIGAAGRLTAVSRGHLDHAELMASATALQRTELDGVAVNEPMRRHVLEHLEHGDGMPAVLESLQRSAGGARPALKNAQLRQYADQASIVEFGPRTGGDVRSGATFERPTLGIASDGRIVETGGTSQVDWLFAGRGADLGGRGLADGIGTLQGVNVSTLNPAMQQRAVAMSGVDPELVEMVGLPAAYGARWQHRLTAHA